MVTMGALAARQDPILRYVRKLAASCDLQERSDHELFAAIEVKACRGARQIVNYFHLLRRRRLDNALGSFPAQGVIDQDRDR